MRKDMSQVLTERSRLGGTRSRKQKDSKDDRAMLKKQSMRKAHTDRKSLNENLNPLKGFLKSRVGQRWDRIHSEISKEVRLTSAEQRRILEHVRSMVCTGVVTRGDGTLWGM